MSTPSHARGNNRQCPSGMPFHRYRPFPAVDLPDRRWPSATITAAPRWLSTDLRDGNQALIDPMNNERKQAMFALLVKMGYKEIEVGFPAASQTDFDFIRGLIESDAVPPDVRISVLTQAREELIDRTVQSLVGARLATVHLYNAAAPIFRDVVFGWPGDGREQCKAVAVDGTRAVMKFAEAYLPGTEFGFGLGNALLDRLQLAVFFVGQLFLRGREARGSSSCRRARSLFICTRALRRC